MQYLNTRRLQRAMQAGVAYVAKQREHINKINVFPVADGDTGTNLMFTMTALEGVNLHTFNSLQEYTQQLARAAVDGARGNSGAIFAQFLQGMHEGLISTTGNRLNGIALADAFGNAAKIARQAMAKPVKGTMLTVMRAFADAFRKQARAGDSLDRIFLSAYRVAQTALDQTPEQLQVLKEAGVVDAGAQGFVDFLTGIKLLIEQGDAALPVPGQVHELPDFDIAIDHENPEHRYCTECVIEGQAMQRQQILHELQTLDASSTVVAGDASRLRIHIHVDRPDEVFRLCGLHGEVSQQKADDMYRQMNTSRQAGKVTIVTDSASDLPEALLDELGIHRVSLRFNFGGRDYLDRISMTMSDFYRLLASSQHQPQTSQPPVGDYRRVYELVRGQRRRVMTISLAASLSGTYQAAVAAAGDDPKIEVIDTLNASAGQGLLVIAAAQLANSGSSRREIRTHMERLIPLTTSYATTRDLDYAVKGGRVKPWLAKIAKLLFIQPVLRTDDQGQLKPCGVMRKRTNQHRAQPKAFARWLGKRLSAEKNYRLIITHGNDGLAAETLKEELLRYLPNIDACWVSETGPAVGVHAGPGVLVVGVQEWSN